MHLLKDAQLIRNAGLACRRSQRPDRPYSTSCRGLIPGASLRSRDGPSSAAFPRRWQVGHGDALQDSPDGVTFTPIAALAPLVVTGAGGAGAQAVMRKVRVEWDTQQYLQANVAVDAGAGDNTAAQFTLSLVF